MKLNNRGWGMQAMMAIVVVLMLALVFVSMMINTKFKSDVTSSSSQNTKLENKVITASQKYYQNHQINLKENAQYRVNLKTLMDEGLLEEITYKGISCSGYGLIIDKNGKIDYEGFIKCGTKYKTKGYE